MKNDNLPTWASEALAAAGLDGEGWRDYCVGWVNFRIGEFLIWVSHTGTLKLGTLRVVINQPIPDAFRLAHRLAAALSGTEDPRIKQLEAEVARLEWLDWPNCQGVWIRRLFQPGHGGGTVFADFRYNICEVGGNLFCDWGREGVHPIRTLEDMSVDNFQRHDSERWLLLPDDEFGLGAYCPFGNHIEFNGDIWQSLKTIPTIGHGNIIHVGGDRVPLFVMVHDDGYLSFTNDERGSKARRWTYIPLPSIESAKKVVDCISEQFSAALGLPIGGTE